MKPLPAALLLATLCLSDAALAAPWLRDRNDRPIEPVEIPPSVKTGIDMVFVDPDLAPEVRRRERLLPELGLTESPGPAIDMFQSVSPFHKALRRGLAAYRAEWSRLPQRKIPEGSPIKPGATGERIASLRERLGLPVGTSYDEALGKVVKRYQQVHGLKADGVVGSATVASLNLGWEHYERVLMLNLDRARTLPSSEAEGRYIVVDAGAARLYMFEDGKIVDGMKVIVGKKASATPMMASMIRYASVNPYWNVPVDLAQSLIAPKVLSEGLGHIQSERYQILSDWLEGAQEVDPASVNWRSVADGTTELRIRQLPGRGNSMGKIKFMMPNDYGIYLHDTNDRTLFGREDRWISNGCVRVEDAERLAAWLYGKMPEGKNPSAEEDVALAKPVPVYITYMTAGTDAGGIAFRPDPYGHDARLVERSAAASAAS